MKTNRLIYVLIGILAIWLAANTAVIKTQNEKRIEENINKYTVSGFSTDLTKVASSVKTSIVTINADGNISSGFVYKQEDNKVYVVSSYHGVDNANIINVTFANAYVAAGNVVYSDIYSDLAIIEINTPYDITPMLLGDSSICVGGEFVISIGTPTSMDYAGSIEMGIISKELITIENEIKVEDKTHTYYEDLIQLSSNLKPGFSGAPIINMKGEAIGMCLMNDSDGHNFVLPINEIKTICDKFFTSGDARKIQLGVKGLYVNSLVNYEKSYLNLSIETIDGLYVQKVKENSFASLIGIKQGDVITSINGKEIANINDYLSIVYTDDTNFEFVINRANEEIKITGTLND